MDVKRWSHGCNSLKFDMNPEWVKLNYFETYERENHVKCLFVKIIGYITKLIYREILGENKDVHKVYKISLS